MTGRQTNYRRNMRIHVLRLLTSLSLLLLPSLGSLAATLLSSNVDSTLQLKPEPRGLRRVFEAGIPLIGMGIGYNLYNNLVRDVRRSHTPWFRYRYDDYTQFAPLVAQLGLRMVSVEGESKSWGKMLTADAFATTTMLGVVTATKYLTQVARPDGSANNSFPRDAERHWGQLHWSPKLQLASQVRFSPHLALRGYASYLYTPDTITLSAPLGSGSLRVQLPRWSIGSSIVLSL